MLRKRQIKRIIAVSAIVIAVGVTAAILVSRHLILESASGRTYDSVDVVPNHKVALVLGCRRYLDSGGENKFFANRIRAAQALYKAGKVDYILVSGDNHCVDYDEPSAMKQALMELNVREEHIMCDYAGFSTLDSVVRANRVFLEDSFIVVSQQFHNERAIYISRHHGIDAIGFNATEVNAYNGFMTRCREQLARVKTVLDVHVINRQSRFLGEPIVIGGDEA